MALGSPAISDIRTLDVRSVQAAVSNARQRIEALERAIVLVQSSSGGSSSSSGVLTALRAQVTVMAATVAVLDAVLSGTGLVAVSGGVLFARVLQAGSNITITYPDGAAGNPVIAATGAPDGVLYDDTGRALLTGDGRAILVGT